MGFDCTLHLIDEHAIRTEFVPRLLKKKRKPTDLERVQRNASKLWTHVRKSLETDEPEIAAQYVCNLAVCFAACSLPHHYERGFALSLWADQDEEIDTRFPARFHYDPEPLFADVVARYPDLHEEFPTAFTSNYTTGVFVPSDKVAEVLRWVENRVGKFTKGRQREFKGLLRILRAAAERGLAYWEATDLAIPIIGQAAGDPGLVTADFLGNEPGTPGRALEMAPVEGHLDVYHTAAHGSWLVSTDRSLFGTNIWDLSVWPPPLVASLPTYAPYHDMAPDGTWLLLGMSQSEFLGMGQSDTTPRAFLPNRWTGPGSPFEPVPFEGDPRSRAGGWVGERLLLFRYPPVGAKKGDPLPAPLCWDGRTWGPAPGLAPVLAQPSILPNFVKDPVCGLARLPGVTVVIWDGNGYQWTENAFAQEFSLDILDSHVIWTSVSAGEDGFFYLSNRCLFEVHLGGQPRRHIPLCSNIMAVSPGPAGSLLLKEGSNDDGDLGKLYFPEDGTFIHIEPELFDDNNHSLLHYSAGSGHLLTTNGREFFAVPMASVLSLPRGGPH